MPKFYCDYCDVFLTHDSPSVRKLHNNGWKHKTNVRAFYAQFLNNEEIMKKKQKKKQVQQNPFGNGIGNLPNLPFVPKHIQSTFIRPPDVPNQFGQSNNGFEMPSNIPFLSGK